MKPNNGMTDIGIPKKLNDRFGSQAASQQFITWAAGVGHKRSFNHADIQRCDGQRAARIRIR